MAFVGSLGVWGAQQTGVRSVSVQRPARRTARQTVVAVEQNVVVGVATAVAGTAAGVGLLAWTEVQGKRNEERENQQACVECVGNMIVTCNVCEGSGWDPVAKEKKEKCTYCEGEGSLSCSNCNGSGIQPRFLDRLSPDDFMD